MTSFSLPAWLQTVHHDGSASYVSDLYPRLDDTVRIRLRVGADVPLQRPFLRTFPDGEQAFTPLEPTTKDDTSQWWEAELKITQPILHYRFVLQAEDGVWFYTAAGAAAHLPLDNNDFRILADYEAPGWLNTAVFYQIFPDRFYNGNPATNPQPDEFEFQGHRPRIYPWGQAAADDQPFPIIFYGGDLPGIIQKLDYLQELGINALYLNPIFTAYSNHKYDVNDYENVDPHFGGNEALAALRQALNEREMRYLLDIVPNHCGYWHPWFQTAQADANAPEADFFTFNTHPNDYHSWLGVWTLPKLDYRSQELRRLIYQNHDAVFRRWLRPPFAADGWRVDVANMLGRQGGSQIGDEIATGIRRAVKETRPDAYLMGENFFDASPQLQGKQWDGVMNYSGLTLPLWYWLDGYTQGAHGLQQQIQTDQLWSTAALATTWQNHLAVIPWAIALQQYNVLDSHDVPRIRSLVQGNDALHRLAVIVQFTFPGIPGLYYGDEIGMMDEAGFESRGCMVWDEARWDHDLLNFYKKLIELRKKTAVLQQGGFQILAIETDSFAYQRESDAGRILIIAHRGKRPRPAAPLPVAHGGIPNGTRFVEYFTRQELVVTDGMLPLPKHHQGATLWQMA
ncbi:MAG: maltodextrin glucosidase [Chloroflexi bacterium]|nr:maltodextrin glucosidase [Chloroflexota bacterium]